MRIKGAIFDMDGTLVDSLGFWKDIWAHFGEKYLGVPDYPGDPELTRVCRTTTVSGAARVLHDALGFGESAGAFEAELTEFFAHLYRTEAKLKPGAMELLRALADRGVKMCVASASNLKLVGISIERCGIGSFFPRVISCDEVGHGKDRPDVFLLARDRLGTPPDETWVFEDSAVALESARRAGFPTVGVFDVHTPDQARVAAASTVYLGEGKTFADLL